LGASDGDLRGAARRPHVALVFNLRLSIAAARGCPCPCAGRSRRASCPPLTACPLRFAGHRSAAGGLVVAALAPIARLRGTGSPSHRHSLVAAGFQPADGTGCQSVLRVACATDRRAGCQPAANFAQVANLCYEDSCPSRTCPAAGFGPSGMQRSGRRVVTGYSSPARRLRNPASSSTGTPSFVAVASLLPASSPATR